MLICSWDFVFNPLQLFWKDKGYDYAKRSGYYKPDEADEFNQKVEDCWEWLSVKLNQKKADDDESDSDQARVGVGLFVAGADVLGRPWP